MTRECKYPQCSGPVDARGYCHKHYQSWDRAEFHRARVGGEICLQWQSLFIAEVRIARANISRLIMAKDPVRRVAEMQSGCPWPMHIPYAISLGPHAGKYLLYLVERAASEPSSGLFRDVMAREGWWSSEDADSPLLSIAVILADKIGLNYWTPLSGIANVDLRDPNQKKYAEISQQIGANG